MRMLVILKFGFKYFYIIKINIHWDYASSTSKTYELKMATYKNSKPEYFLKMTKNFKKVIDGKVTMSASRRISFLFNMLHVEYLG